MSYKVFMGSERITIAYTSRDPDTNIYDNTFHINIVSEFHIPHKGKEYDYAVRFAENIVIKLNKLDEEINSLKTDLAMSQTPALFNTVESKTINRLEHELDERDYEINHLVNSLYRKTDEFYKEKTALIKEIEKLESKNQLITETMEHVRKTELSKIPTSELAKELYSRLKYLDKLENNHSKLLKKHKTAAGMIADLKNNQRRYFP